MALVLDATPGGVSANSYVTEARASALLEARLYTEPWFGTSTMTPLQLAELAMARPASLCWATRLMNEQMDWYGSPTTTTQALPVPMTGVTDRYGRPVSSTTIPLAVEQATAEFALALLRDQREAFGMEMTSNIKSKKLGDYTIVYQDTATTPISTGSIVAMPAAVKQMLTPYGAVIGGVMVPLLRS